jgi:hypothetical protein
MGDKFRSWFLGIAMLSVEVLQLLATKHVI